MLHDRFGRDQRDKLVRQMFHISQTSTITDYVESFSTLFDQLKAYQPNPDMHYFTTQFVDGLRDDIRMVITLQCPSTLDTAYSLALLQEEVAASVLKTDNTRPGFRPYHKLAITMPKPNAADKTLPEKTSLKSSDDKLSTLRAYRRARDLCEVCAEKWMRGPQMCSYCVIASDAGSVGFLQH